MTQNRSIVTPTAASARGEAKPPEPPPLTEVEQTAIAYARDNSDAYPRRWRKTEMSYSVINAELQEDGSTRVTMTYRPATGLGGRPGEEYLCVMPDGEVIERVQIHAPQEAFPWVLSSLTVVMVGLAVLAGIVIWGQDKVDVDTLYKSGRYLYIRVSEPKSADAITYANADISGNPKTFQITRENADTELAMVNVELHNPNSGQMIMLINEAAAALLTEDGQSYELIDIVERSIVVNNVPESQLERGFVGLWRTQTINAGETLKGWMVFEIPKGAGYREFRWIAADRVDFRYE